MNEQEVVGISTELDILEQLTDDTVKLINANYLENRDAIKGVFNKLAINVRLQADFIQKISHETLAKYCQDDWIPEEAFGHIFSTTTLSQPFMIGFLRAVEFDCRDYILALLRQNNVAFLSDLEETLDHDYGMEYGVFYEIEKPQSLKRYKDELTTVMEQRGRLDYFKQLLNALYRFFKDDYLKFLDYFYKQYDAWLRSFQIKTQKDLDCLVKLSYFIAYSSNIRDKRDLLYQSLIKQCVGLMRSLKVGPYCQILNRLPALMIHDVLRFLDSKGDDQRYKPWISSILTWVESYKMPYIRKCIRRGSFEYLKLCHDNSE